jgi:hypothetical protein
MVQRQRFYTELNDVQAERMFVENIMKLGNQFFFSNHRNKYQIVTRKYRLWLISENDSNICQSQINNETFLTVRCYSTMIKPL